MKKILLFIVTLCLLCRPVCVYAAELNESTASRDAVISAEVPSTHTMTISSDKVAVIFGGKTGTTFEVPRLTEFTLHINTDKGYQVTKVLLNGEDVTKAYKDGKLTLSGIYETAKLTIQTEKVLVTPGGETTKLTIQTEKVPVTPRGETAKPTIQTEKVPVTSGGDSTSPQTGDNSNLNLWFVVMFISSIGFASIAIYYRRKRTN